MRIVFDTNVIVSGLNFRGSERLLLRLTNEDRFELFLSEFILSEASSVLRRKFDWSEARITLELTVLRDTATILSPPQVVSAIAGDHADNRVLECAVFASADYLVTGDRKHLLPLETFEGVRILRAPDFLKILADA